MEKEQKDLKVILNMITPFIEKQCGTVTIDFDDDLNAESNKFYCHRDYKEIPLPIPLERYLETYLDSIRRDLSDCGNGDTDCYRYQVRIDGESRVFEIDGIYTSYGEDETDGSSVSFDNDEDVKEAIRIKREEGLIPPYSVTFDGGGDSGYVEDTMEDKYGKRFPIPAPLETVCYNLLEDFGGWEINEGSFGSILFDESEEEAYLNFVWRTEEPARDTLVRFNY